MGMQEDLAVTRTVNLSTVVNRTFLDSDFRYTLFPVFYGVVVVLGLIANSYVLFVLQHMHDCYAMSEIRIYMANLTCADLLFVCALPFWIGYYHHRGDWRYGDFLCRVTGVFFFFINTYCSILFLAAISVNRYWAITRPLYAASSDCWRRGVAITAVIWVLTLSMSVPYLLETGIQVDDGNMSRCFEGYHNKTDDEKRTVATTHLIIVGCFVLVFFLQGPWTLAVLEIKEGWGRMDWGQRTRQWLNDAHQVTLMLMGLNCLLDPVVYCFATRKFRLVTRKFREGERMLGNSHHTHF
ncbi:platelet-activating factor receptor-like [Salvelinus namaycush]|uniref:Platelet-activating factor receptor n=1 Tax=Salvelinus namaycush TaxID=8040 RepID=A0A8U1ERY7_SALNM|nr:platelet-activating factor receptor-like [Salvelinus namaycush]